MPNSISVGQFDYLRAYDPIKDDILEVVPSLVEETIIANFNFSNVPIYINDTLLITPLDEQETKRESISTNFDLGLDFDLYIDLNDTNRNIFRYKGVPFDSKVSIEGVAGSCDIFSKNAAHWLTIDRKKQNPESSHELGDILNTLVDREYKTIKLNSSSQSDADFYFYTLYSKEGCESWGEAELNGIKIKDYFSGSEKLIISNLHEVGGIKNGRTSIFSWGFRSRLLGKLINKIGLSFKIVLDQKVAYTLHNRELNYEDYSIEFGKEGLTCHSIDIELVKIWLARKPNAGCARSMVPLFDVKYINIALNIDDIEPWMYCHTDFPHWYTKVVLLPARDQHKAIDLEAIYIFYARKNRCVIDKKEFMQLYNELWEELGV
ncbi:hypothetical protein [Pantoea agglomerans]|uniref:hypothetical protein n=1 Tax=Enterobacter agglomerans TaxID=549 RepID=UPI0004D3BEC7|nr:hypothetical protein [Pantoea agglomerans]KEY40025.1 hypothetical protein FB99_46310 [Pantoea agglomerans]